MRRLQPLVGQAIRSARVGRGLNQVVVARTAGMSSALLSLIENGLRAVKDDELDRLLLALDLDCQQLLRLSGALASCARQ